MRCEYCPYAKETIPEQKHYLYCTLKREEVADDGFSESCFYREPLSKNHERYLL